MSTLRRFHLSALAQNSQYFLNYEIYFIYVSLLYISLFHFFVKLLQKLVSFVKDLEHLFQQFFLMPIIFNCVTQN